MEVFVGPTSMAVGPRARDPLPTLIVKAQEGISVVMIHRGHGGVGVG